MSINNSFINAFDDLIFVSSFLFVVCDSLNVGFSSLIIFLGSSDISLDVLFIFNVCVCSDILFNDIRSSIVYVWLLFG